MKYQYGSDILYPLIFPPVEMELSAELQSSIWRHPHGIGLHIRSDFSTKPLEIELGKVR